MWNIEKSNDRCLLCNVQFSQSDVEIMEKDDLPICDQCVCSLIEYHVKYDGNMDLLEFLKSEVYGRRCMNCLEPALVLDRIRFGKPVEGNVLCKECNKENDVYIHIVYI